jgi:hypothetical protein
MDLATSGYDAATVLCDHNNKIIFHHGKECINQMMFSEDPE